MKRPFSIVLEPEREVVMKMVIRLGKQCSTIDETINETKWDNFRWKKVRFKCPCCDSFVDWDKFYSHQWEKPDNYFYELSYKIILNHCKKMVRMNGDTDHMQFIIDYFGREFGTRILEMWARKNIIVAQKINEFIKNVPLQEKQKNVQ